MSRKMSSKESQLAILLLAIFLAVLTLLTNVPGAVSYYVTGPPYSYNPGDQQLGPENWGHLYNNWTNCSYGHRQTPINIKSSKAKVDSNLGKLEFNYKPVKAEAYNTGHGIKVTILGDGGTLSFDGMTFGLTQYHWHWPSEHAINGKRHALELHLVHSSPQGLAVVGVLYDYGQEDPLLKMMLPVFSSIGDQILDLGIIDPREIAFDSSRYYRYTGSLTTPPCSEGVIWTVLTKYNQVTPDQIVQLENIVHDSYPASARPLQSLDGRLVYINPKPCGSN